MGNKIFITITTTEEKQGTKHLVDIIHQGYAKLQTDPKTSK